jgi:ABC-2 type transport system ATP-binding protein
MTVPDGSVYLLVGPTGAGKTPTLKVLLDLIRPTAGLAQVFGREPARDGAAIRAGIGYVPEGAPNGVEWMRVGRYLQHLAAYRPSWDQEYQATLVSEMDIDLRARLGKLSKGQSRRVQLVGALCHRPPLLLLDEPADGLDPVARDRLIQILSRHLADYPTSLLVSTHHIQEMERLADHMGVIEAGRMIAQETKDAYHARLRRYLFESPAEPPNIAELEPSVLHRNGSGTEAAWTIWGEEADVRARLSAGGVTVRAVQPLHLEEAAVALLSGKGGMS